MYHVLSKLDEQNICILGDFNVDVLGKNETVLSSMFKKQSYTQIVTKPTRDSGTLIDHAYVTGELDVSSDVIDCYYSDHDFVVVMVSQKKNDNMLLKK